ncbi:hypothetical protein BB558_005935 [Smittium angustum]|uniref:Coenzyme Q-binding protein COQ10 START domain-containing protein n=1 Tax=Smittium angustum TaxID=133377 RepID=A0A2U1IZB3_SMIAN|nr:hypothetical protein BB558_005935 [Smittium angustum]
MFKGGFSTITKPLLGTEPKFYTEKMILPYSQEQLYNVVSDVDNYKNFVPWCIDSSVFLETKKEILGQNGKVSQVQAALKIGFKQFSEKYTSTVEMHEHSKVSSTSIDSLLFKKLISTWTFTPVENTNVNDNTKNLENSGPERKSFLPINPVIQKQIEQCPDIQKPELGTWVIFEIEFEFRSAIYSYTSKLFFDQVCKKMIGAFTARCSKLYNKTN